MGNKIIHHHVLRDHVLLGGVAAGILLKFWTVQDCLIFWFVTVMVDIDHYLNLIYWSRFRSFSISKMFGFYTYIFENRKNYRFLALEIFHTFEFILVIYVLAFPLHIALLKPVFWGILFHIIVDLFHLKRIGAIRIRNHSIIEFLIRKRSLEREGISATLLQQKAGEMMAVQE